MNNSKTHSEGHIGSIVSGDGKYVKIIGTSLILALIALFAVSTFFRRSTDQEPSGSLPQAAAADSLEADTLGPSPQPPAFREPPPLWLQARGGPLGNGGWSYDIEAPFDTLWHMRANGGREFFSAPALVDSVLYIGCNDGLLRAVDAREGNLLWSFSTVCGICGEPSVDSSSVYFGGQDGYVYAIDRNSGSKQWSAGLGYHIFCDTGILNDSLVVTGNSMGKVCALRTEDGEVAWEGDIGGIVLGPVIADGRAVFTSESGSVAAFSHQGENIWTRSWSGQASPPAADSTGVYVGFSTGYLRKLSIETGELIWEKDLVSTSTRCVLARPVIAADLVFSGNNDGKLVCLDASTGGVIWEQEFDNWLQLPPAVCQELIYLACDDQRLHILQLADGSKVDSLEMKGYSGTAPLVWNGQLYYGNTSGDFTALRGTVPRAEPDSVETEEDIVLETDSTFSNVDAEPGDTDMETDSAAAPDSTQQPEDTVHTVQPLTGEVSGNADSADTEEEP